MDSSRVDILTRSANESAFILLMTRLPTVSAHGQALELA